MKLNLKLLKDSDYQDVLCGWWKDWRWTPPPQDFLPEMGKGGFMVYDGETPVVAGFLYNTNSGIAWCDFIISNFNYKDKIKRAKAINLLLLSLEERAKTLNKTFMYALIKNQSLIKTYEDLGYIKGDAYTSELIKKI
tara:strand:- start:20980 stop:21390 length:411 start_codon:yes stop_codon:yes gene_type:complete